jgi:Predicted ATPase
LIGREREVSALDARSDAVRDGGVVILLRGDAGIGKSALLARASDRAAREGMRVLTVSGVRAEAHIPFAGLHQMVRPLLARAEDFAAPQREALLATFGMNGASAPNVFLVAVSALELLANEAENGRCGRGR